MKHIKKAITPFDNKGRFHGYHEWYDTKGNLRLRTNFKHDNPMGYEEYHGATETRFYIR